MKEEAIKNVTVTETINNNEESTMTNNESSTITNKTNNQENKMTESNATNETANIDIENLKSLYAKIKEDFAWLRANEKSSAEKSYDMGHNLILLQKDNQYRNLLDRNGNQFKTWQSFCEEGCGFTRSYADKLMKSAAIQDKLEEAGVTTIKQSVANLYALHNAKSHDPKLDIAEVWKKASGNDPEAFPTRKAVQKAITPESHASKKVKKSKKVSNNLSSILKAIKASSLSMEDVQKVRQALDDLLKAKTADGTSEKADQEAAPATTIEVVPEKISA